MRLLLDSHTLLWWQTDDERLSDRARSLIGDEASEVFVSAASARETATKQRLGERDEVPEAAVRCSELVAADGFTQLPITDRHCLRAGGYRSTIGIRSSACSLPKARARISCW